MVPFNIELERVDFVLKNMFLTKSITASLNQSEIFTCRFFFVIPWWSTRMKYWQNVRAIIHLYEMKESLEKLIGVLSTFRSRLERRRPNSQVWVRRLVEWHVPIKWDPPWRSSSHIPEKSHHSATETVTAATMMNPESTLDELSGPFCVQKPFHSETTVFSYVWAQSVIWGEEDIRVRSGGTLWSVLSQTQLLHEVSSTV